MSRDFDPARRAVLKYGALSAASLASWPDHATAVVAPTPQPLSGLGYAQVRLAPGPLAPVHLLDGRPLELLTRHVLLPARPRQDDPTRWRTDRGAAITLRAFPDIGKESCNSCQDVVPA